MTSGSMATFGRISPYETQSMGNVLINPASIGGIEFNQFMVSSYQLSSLIDYRHFTTVFPYGEYTIGVSYGTNLTGGFTETYLENNVVYDLGSFSSGFNIMQLSVALKLKQSLLLFDHIYSGIGFNILSQVIDSSTRLPSYGFDVGVIGVSYLTWLSIIDQMDVGISMVNVLSTNLPEWEYDSDVGTSAAQSVERQIYLGTKLHAFDYLTTFHFGVYAQGFYLRDLMMGVGYRVADALDIGFSLTYDLFQTGDFTYNFGSGIMFNRVAGFGSTVYNMSLNYNYTLYPFPLTSDPSHTVSLQFLGEPMDQRPVIITPNQSYSTLDSTLDISGSAAQNSLIYMYNNENLIGQFHSDRYGKWMVEQVPLIVGYNSFTFRSKSNAKDMSKPSLPLVVNYDQVPPSYDIEFYVSNDLLTIDLMSNEPLKDARLQFLDKEMAFRKRSDLRYSVRIPLPDYLKSGQPIPDQMASFNVVVSDMVGNQAPIDSISLFVEPLFPSDQTIVYNDSITAVGYASAICKKHIC